MLFECPHCKAKCQFNVVVTDNQCRVDDKYQAPWVCQNCGGFIITKRPYTHTWQDTKIFPLIKIKILNKLVKLMKTVKITIVLTLIVWFAQSGCKKNDCEKTDWKKTVFAQWNTTLFVVTTI